MWVSISAVSATGDITCQFTSTDRANNFLATVETFYIGNVALDPSTAGATFGVDSNRFNIVSVAAAQEFDSATEVYGSYVIGEVQPDEDITILDTFTAPGGGNGPNWKSSNQWWNGWHTSGGTWASTGTLTGTYVGLDSGSQLRTNAFRLGPATGTELPANAQVRVTFTPSEADSGTSVIGSAIGGDESFYWSGGPFTAAQIEEGGTFGWNKDDDVTIEIFTVLGKLIAEGGKSKTSTGGVESSIEGGTLVGIPGLSSLNKMQFRDSVKNGEWTDDGLGLLWTFNDSAEVAASEAGLPDSGTFTVCETGTKNVLFTYTYGDRGTFTGNVEQYDQVPSNCFSGVVPANKQLVDIYIDVPTATSPFVSGDYAALAGYVFPDGAALSYDSSGQNASSYSNAHSLTRKDSDTVTFTVSLDGITRADWQTQNQLTGLKLFVNGKEFDWTGVSFAGSMTEDHVDIELTGAPADIDYLFSGERQNFLLAFKLGA